jgi:hypothetical protein
MRKRGSKRKKEKPKNPWKGDPGLRTSIRRTLKVEDVVRRFRTHTESNRKMKKKRGTLERGF